MAMDSKGRILSQIEAARFGTKAAPESSPAAEPRQPRHDDIGSEGTVLRFVEMLEKVGGEGHILNGAEAALSVLRGMLGEFCGQAALVPPVAELDRLGVLRLAQECDVGVLQISSAAQYGAEKAVLGITVAQGGIADTGTVILWHEKDEGRFAGLLPPTHIVLLPASQVYPDKTTFLHAMRAQKVDLGTTPMTWVTGPSLTADIEKVLVRGAHGPGRVIALIY